jgi:hypothetical protein
MPRELTGPMKSALRWMDKGNEVDLSLIDGFGYSAEMPRRATLQALCNRGLAEVEKRLGGFSVSLTNEGRQLAKELNE